MSDNNIIIICGCPRTGKTTLTRQILNKDPSYRVISLDSLYYSLKDSFPVLKIENYRSINELSQRLLPFVKNIIKEYSCDFQNLKIIIEGMEILPSAYKKDSVFSSSKIVCFGFPDANEDELFLRIRNNDDMLQYDTYTMHMSDDELKKRVKFYIRFSNELLKECENNSIPYWNLEYGRERILECALRYLTES